MTFKRIPLTKVTLREVKAGRGTTWVVEARDANGNLRSRTSGPRDYLEKKAAEWWPELPIERASGESSGLPQRSDVIALSDKIASRVSPSKRRLAFSILGNAFGTPENARRGMDEERAVFSAATLAAPRLGLKFPTVQTLVREWFAGARS